MNDEDRAYVETWKALTDYPRSFHVLAAAFFKASQEEAKLEDLGRAIYDREAGIDALAIDRAIVALVALYSVKLGISPREYFERAFQSAPADGVWAAMLEEWKT